MFAVQTLAERCVHDKSSVPDGLGSRDSCPVLIGHRWGTDCRPFVLTHEYHGWDWEWNGFWSTRNHTVISFLRNTIPPRWRDTYRYHACKRTIKYTLWQA